MNRPPRDDWAMELARTTAKQATCLRRSVGCVLLDARGHVLSTGYNGVASGRPHCNEFSVNGFVLDARVDVRTATELMLRHMPHVRTEQVDTDSCRLEPYPPGCPDGRQVLRFKWARHACEGQHLSTRDEPGACQAIHAEQNALLQCRDVYQVDTCYTTTAPCVTCLKLLLNTSCRRVVFDEPYPHGDAQAWWTDAGREWVQHGAGRPS